jgi:hypothetical protein
MSGEIYGFSRRILSFGPYDNILEGSLKTHEKILISFSENMLEVNGT